jgi:hypothetical protein
MDIAKRLRPKQGRLILRYLPPLESQTHFSLKAVSILSQGARDRVSIPESN